jgi:endo-1,4-beta-mannosidase
MHSFHLGWACGPLAAALCVLGGSLASGAERPAAAQAPVVTAQAELPAVALKGNYFSRGGKRFVPVGVNWVPAKAGMAWPYQWNAAEVEADFAQMHELGVNAVRLDLVWPWWEPRADDFNPEAFKQMDELIALANKYKIYLHPELLVGGEVGEAYWDVPYRHGRDPHTDPFMLRVETDFAARVAKSFGQSPAILGWDLTDEPPFWISQGTSDSAAINWTRLITGAIRRYDTRHPMVVGTSMQDVERGPFRPDMIAGEVEFLSVHPYTIFSSRLFPDPMLSERQTYGAAFETALSSGAGRPVMVQELGASTAQYSPAAVARYERTAMYSSLAAGANGFLLWCYTDAAPEQIAKAPYLRSPQETQFGVVTWDRKPKPAAEMMKEFSATMDAMDLEGVEPAQGEAGILVPDEWAKPYGDESHLGLTGPEIAPYVSTYEGGAVAGQALPAHGEENTRLTAAWLATYILARRAGLKPEFPREYGEWRKYPLLLMASPLTGTNTILSHPHADFWAKAKAYVNEGGVLWASLSGDAAIPEMAELFGARMVDQLPVHEAVLKVVKPFGGLKVGESFHWAAAAEDGEQWEAVLEAKDGEVIAVDANGKPALVAHKVGKGTTLLCAFPIELYLSGQAMAFEGNDQTHRLYQALVEAAGVKRTVWTDQTQVEVGALNAKDRGYLIVVNHSDADKHVKLHTSLPVHALKSVRGGAAPVEKDGGWSLDVKAWDAEVLEWK